MVFWIIPALIGAFFDAVYVVINKHILKDQDEYVVGTGVFLGASVVLLLTSLINGLPKIGENFFFATIATAALNVVALVLFFKALKKLDISLAVPLLAFTPIFMIFSSFVLLGELPSFAGVIGMFAIVIGAYIMNFKKKQAHFLEPVTLLYKNIHMRYVLLVAFIFSFSASIDKIVLLNSDPFFSSGSIFLTAGIMLLFVMKLKKKSMQPLKTHAWKFLISGSALALSVIAINYAYLSQIAPYVISIKRTSILFSVVFGYLIFKESYVLNRFIGALFMVAGVTLILLL